MITSNSTLGNAPYVYDANGRRVKRTVGATNTLYLYNGGAVLSEFANPSQGVGTWQKDYIYLNGALLATESATEGTRFHFSDHLGTPRVITDAAGTVLSRHDYYPYGREITSSSDGETHKFTGKERDPESGLDFFGARYYASQYGRFISADWSAVPIPVPYADFSDPQTLDLYSYIRNNPLSHADIDGHCCEAEWNYFKQELKGVWDTTGGGLVEAAKQFANGQAATNVRETYSQGDVLGNLGEAGKELVSQAANMVSSASQGDPRAIGQIAGILISAKVAKEVKGQPEVNGTNESGQLTSRTSLRKSTVQGAWDNATDGPSGGKLCPTCGKEVKVAPRSGLPRDWDVHHGPKWTDRKFSPSATRKQVIENYQEGTSLKCVSCNRSNID